MVDEASARAAFSTIYEKDGWDWGNITDAHQNAQRVAGLLQNILRDGVGDEGKVGGVKPPPQTPG
jgi:hypothetical protein